MLIISLDECGRFEGNTWLRGIVAGTIFSCNNWREGAREQERILDYLSDVCSYCNARFPDDLHPEFCHGEAANAEALSRVQQRIRETFGEFLQDETNGRYYLYAVASEPKGVSMFESETAGNLLRDNYAGNRYLHMTQMAIRNLVINNPKLQDQDYALHLATRILSENATTDDQKNEARTLGMLQMQDQEGRYTQTYRLTDANSYISMLSAAIMDDERENVNFDLMVAPISYKYNPRCNKMQAFMLLADIVCDLVQPEMKDKAGQLPQRLAQKLNLLTSHQENMVWCYHDVDFALRRALDSVIEGRWFRCLQQLYAIKSRNDDQGAFYRDHWMEPVLEQLKQRKEPQRITEAADRLAAYLQEPNYDPEAARFIGQQLLELTEEDSRYGFCRYRLNSCLLTLYNHAGDDARAEDCYQLCAQYAISAPLVEYLELRNGYSVTLLNRKHYGKALENTRKTVELEELADEMKRKAFGDGEGISIHHGRSLSQLGQCYGYLEQYDQAIECFRNALEAFKSSPVDLQITRSYLLHAYIEAGKKREFGDLATEYFGSSDSKAQLEGIYQMENTTYPYALLVYLKGWYRLNPNGFYARIAGPLLEGVLKKGQGKMGHPWQLIWKYVALLADLSKKPELAAEAAKRLTAIRDQSDGLLREICQEGLESCAAGKETGKLTYMNR